MDNVVAPVAPQLSVALCPLAMVAGEATKLAMTGLGEVTLTAFA
jgi:hypothetical protein